MKVDFDAFAEWYLGDMPNNQYIVDEFEDQLDMDVRELIGTQIELEVTYCESIGLYECNINNGQFILDAIENYFDQL